jgi:D-alanine--poly(phosphoribitol) ligase subunit 1
MTLLAPLGKINQNFDYLIVDDELNEVKKGDKGELLLIGPNISPGYYGDPTMTSEVFIQHPLKKKYSEKCLSRMIYILFFQLPLPKLTNK